MSLNRKISVVCLVTWIAFGMGDKYWQAVAVSVFFASVAKEVKTETIEIKTIIEKILKEAFTSKICLECPGFIECSLAGFPNISSYIKMHQRKSMAMCSVNKNRLIGMIEK